MNFPEITSGPGNESMHSSKHLTIVTPCYTTAVWIVLASSFFPGGQFKMWIITHKPCLAQDQIILRVASPWGDLPKSDRVAVIQVLFLNCCNLMGSRQHAFSIAAPWIQQFRTLLTLWKTVKTWIYHKHWDSVSLDPWKFFLGMYGEG